MEKRTYTITFEHGSVADANRWAGELKELILDTTTSVKVEQKRDNQSSQDLGSTLVLVLGTPANLAVAKALGQWLTLHREASITIKTPQGEIVGTKLSSKDALRLAELMLSQKNREIFLMVDMRPSPQTTLGILLGASKWPHSSLQDSPAFAKSAQKIRDYFLHSERFGIRQENWLDLFDKNQSSPHEVDKRISTFLQQRIKQMKQAGMPARDVLFYYIGHGVFALGSDQAFHLAIRSTRDESLRVSALAMAALAETLKINARQLRRLVILIAVLGQKLSNICNQQLIKLPRSKQSLHLKKKVEDTGFPEKGRLCSALQGIKRLLFSCQMKVVRCFLKHSFEPLL